MDDCVSRRAVLGVLDYYRLPQVVHDRVKMLSRMDTPILDKIRAEIEQEYNCLSATRADETLELGECLGLKMALKIINKYR